MERAFFSSYCKWIPQHKTQFYCSNFPVAISHFGSLSHVANLTVPLAGWKGYFPPFHRGGYQAALRSWNHGLHSDRERKLKSCCLQLMEVEGKWENSQVLFCPMALTHSSPKQYSHFVSGFSLAVCPRRLLVLVLYQCSSALTGNHKIFNAEKGSDYPNLLSETLAVPVYAPCFLLSPDVQLCRIMHTNCS